MFVSKSKKLTLKVCIFVNRNHGLIIKQIERKSVNNSKRDERI